MSTLELTYQSEGWPDSEACIRTAVTAAQSVLPDARTGELSVVLSDDAQVRALNRDYRRKDKATNVLSFPQTGALLGDIVLARETLEREAADKNISFETHLIHLVIHGWLHLQGLDHAAADEADAMESLEIAALATLGIDNPYGLDDD